MRCAAITVTMICATAVGAGELSSGRQREILRRALNAFDDATEIARNDPARAEEMFRASAAAFETLIDGGLRNPSIEYDLGNAYMRLGRTGLAILHYRRGLRMNRSHGAMVANLAYARKRVQPVLEESGESRLARTVLSWHYQTSLRGRLWAAGILSVVGWLALLLRMRRRPTPILVPAMACIVVSLACCGSVVWELRESVGEPRAVVCGAEYTLRLGSGEGSDAAMNVGAGVELRIIGQRGDWIEVRLVNGQKGWLPEAAIERI